MKGISPLIASVLLIAITMTLAAILATFVSNYTRQQLSALPSCVGGTLNFVTGYPKLSSTTITAAVEVTSVDLTGFTVEAIDNSGNVTTIDGGNSTIKAGSAGTVSATGFPSGVTKAKIVAKNCPSVSTDWTTLIQ